MPSVDQPGFWSFATLQMPPGPTGSYQTIGLLLKIAGWIRLVQLGLAVLVGGIMLVMLIFVGAVGGALAPAMGRWEIPALGGLMLLVAVVVLLLVIAFFAAFTYWTSWIYAKWVAKDPRALKHLFSYAVVTVVLSGLAALGGLAGNPSSLIDIGLLVIGILLIIESRKPEMQDFGFPTGPETWQSVDE